MAKFMITGGCGFIGSHLAADLLAAGHAVHVLDDLSGGRRESLPVGAELTVGDVADFSVVRQVMEGCDGCFHLAARTAIQESLIDWRGTHRSNQTGSVTIFDAARSFDRPVPVVYASSASVYGDNPALPLAETAKCAPLTPYAADKLGSEMHGRAAWHSHGVPNTGLRFFNVYGPFERNSIALNVGAIATFAAHILKGQTVVVHGDGRQIRDFIHVSDVVAHMRAAMQRQREAAVVYNVCSGQPTSILQLVELLGRLAGMPPRLQFEAPRTGDIQNSLGDPSFATAELGLSVTIELADGLRRMLDYLLDTAVRSN